MIRDLRDQGFGVVFVSHYLNEVSQLSDDLTVLRDGIVAAHGPTQEFSTERIVREMVGDVSDLYSPEGSRRGPAVLSVQSGRTDLVRDLSFQLFEGEILGIAAPKGEGVSDFLRALCGVAGRLDGSVIRLRGKELRIGNASQALKRGIGYVSEERGRWGVLHGRSVRENMSVSTLHQMSSRAGVLSLPREKRHVAELAEAFSVRAPSLEGGMGTLSGGNQQKALLARLLGAKLAIYVLDDPTFGVDVKSKSEINALIRRQVSEGSAVIMHSSDLDELLNMCDRILLVKKGRLREEFLRGRIDQPTLEKRLEAY